MSRSRLSTQSFLSAVGDELRARGFMRQGTVFHRTTGDIEQYVYFSRSPKSPPNELWIGVGVSVLSLPLFRLTFGLDAPVTWGMSQIAVNVSQFEGSLYPQLWEIHDFEELERYVAAAKRVLLSSGMSFLSTIRTTDDIAKCLQNGQWLNNRSKARGEWEAKVWFGEIDPSVMSFSDYQKLFSD